MKVLYTVQVELLALDGDWRYKICIDDQEPLYVRISNYANIGYAEMIKDYIYERNIQGRYSVLAQVVDTARVNPATLVFVMQHRTTSHILADLEARQLLERERVK